MILWQCLTYRLPGWDSFPSSVSSFPSAWVASPVCPEKNTALLIAANVALHFLVSHQASVLCLRICYWPLGLQSWTVLNTSHWPLVLAFHPSFLQYMKACTRSPSTWCWVLLSWSVSKVNTTNLSLRWPCTASKPILLSVLRRPALLGPHCSFSFA